MNKKIYSAGFAIALILIGTTLAVFNIGTQPLFGFNTIGNYLVYIGFIALVISLFKIFFQKKRVIDERMISLAYESSRWTFLVVILAAFVCIVIDGINPITVSYHIFLGYAIMFLVFTNLIIYHILLKYK